MATGRCAAGHAQKQARYCLLSDKGYVQDCTRTALASPPLSWSQELGMDPAWAAGCPSPRWPVNPVGNGASGR